MFCAYSILSTSWETKKKSRTIIKDTFEFSYWSRQDPWSLISWEFDDDDDDDNNNNNNNNNNTVYQGSTRVFRDGPENKYFRICGPRGRGKIKDVYKVRTQHPHRFIYYRSICIVENKFNQILGETFGKHEIFGGQNCASLGLRISDLQRSIVQSHQIRLFWNEILRKFKNLVILTKA